MQDWVWDNRAAAVSAGGIGQGRVKFPFRVSWRVLSAQKSFKVYSQPVSVGDHIGIDSVRIPAKMGDLFFYGTQGLCGNLAHRIVSCVHKMIGPLVDHQHMPRIEGEFEIGLTGIGMQEFPGTLCIAAIGFTVCSLDGFQAQQFLTRRFQ